VTQRNAAPKVTDFSRYKVILAPVITEKATLISQYNQVTFKVASWATKGQIKAAVESIFSVKVEGVNTLIQKGKTKRFRGRIGQRSDVKKAIVRLAEGQTLDVSTGV
jgi:large subunit ribosomal protein L23